MNNRKFPRGVKYSLVLLIASGLLMVLFSGNHKVFSNLTIKEIFLIAWIIFAINIGIYSLLEWIESFKKLIFEKKGVRIFGHLLVLAFIFWGLFEIISGLTKSIIK